MRILHATVGLAMLGGTALAGETVDPNAVMAGEGDLELGYLECELSAASGSVVNSNLVYDCTFDAADDAQPDVYYQATTEKVGLDLSKTDQETVRWAVLAATDSRLGADGLSGRYAGVSVDAALGAGAGAKLLVGGSDQSITLQPVSVSTQEGYGLSLAIETMELTFIGVRG